MWNATFQYLDDAESVLVQDCLSTLRILSRDKTHMEEVLTDRQIQTLLRLANIDPILATTTTKDEPVIVESLKCLCNLVFNSATCQDLFDRMNGAEGIIRRIRLYRCVQRINSNHLRLIPTLQGPCGQVRDPVLRYETAVPRHRLEYQDQNESARRPEWSR